MIAEIREAIRSLVRERGEMSFAVLIQTTKETRGDPGPCKPMQIVARSISRGVDRAPWRGVRARGGPRLRLVWPGWSGGHGWQLDDGIIAERGDGFQGHVAGALDGPFIVLFQQDGPDEAGDGGLVGEYADHIGATLDLAVQSFDRVGAWILGRCSLGKAM